MDMLRAKIEQWRGDRAAAGARRHPLAAIGRPSGWGWAAIRWRGGVGAALGIERGGDRGGSIGRGDRLGERAVIGRRAPIGRSGGRWAMCSAAIGGRRR
jgi:hypothetical protein